MNFTGNQTFTIHIEKEDNSYIGYVLENNISSFGDTEEQALRMTQEALFLWVESQMNYKLKKLQMMMDTIKKVDNTYRISIDASDIQSQRDMSKTREDLILA